MNAARAEAVLRCLLRVIGTAALLALVPTVMPFAWMDAIHRWLGLGALPDPPIVPYLARSLSLFYALNGGLLWVFSFDLERHRLALSYTGCAFVASGVFLLGIDYSAGLPKWWWTGEGPFVIAMGALILGLTRRLQPRAARVRESGG